MTPTSRQRNKIGLPVEGLMETFLEYETMCREKPPGHVFVGRFAEIDPRKVAEVVPGSRDKKLKKQCLFAPFFRALSTYPPPKVTISAMGIPGWGNSSATWREAGHYSIGL